MSNASYSRKEYEIVQSLPWTLLHVLQIGAVNLREHSNCKPGSNFILSVLYLILVLINGTLDISLFHFQSLSKNQEAILYQQPGKGHSSAILSKVIVPSFQ